VDLPQARTIQRLQAEPAGTRESCFNFQWRINLDRKPTGERSAGNPHATFAVAGAGNPLTVWLVRHSQRKRGETARLNLRSRAPVLDPTKHTIRTPTFLTFGECNTAAFGQSGTRTTCSWAATASALGTSFRKTFREP